MSSPSRTFGEAPTAPAPALPPTVATRWSPRRKAEVVLAARSGNISREEAYRRYFLSPEELAAWEAALDQNGLPVCAVRASRAIASRCWARRPQREKRDTRRGRAARGSGHVNSRRSPRPGSGRRRLKRRGYDAAVRRGSVKAWNALRLSLRAGATARRRCDHGLARRGSLAQPPTVNTRTIRGRPYCPHAAKAAHIRAEGGAPVTARIVPYIRGRPPSAPSGGPAPEPRT